MRRARGGSSPSRLNLGAGTRNAVAHTGLLYLVSEAERVGGSAREGLTLLALCQCGSCSIR